MLSQADTDELLQEMLEKYGYPGMHFPQPKPEMEMAEEAIEIQPEKKPMEWLVPAVAVGIVGLLLYLAFSMES